MGEQGRLETADEIRLETIVPAEKVHAVVQAMLAAHPYEEAAYDIYPVEQTGKKEALAALESCRRKSPSGNLQSS